MSAFDSLEDRLINLTLGSGVTFPDPPSKVAVVGLMKSSPTENYDGTPGSFGEPPLGSVGYVRQPARFPATLQAESATRTNEAALSFTGLTPGIYTHFSIFDELPQASAVGLFRDPTTVYPGATVPGQTVPMQTIPGTTTPPIGLAGQSIPGVDADSLAAVVIYNSPISVNTFQQGRVEAGTLAAGTPQPPAFAASLLEKPVYETLRSPANARSQAGTFQGVTDANPATGLVPVGFTTNSGTSLLDMDMGFLSVGQILRPNGPGSLPVARRVVAVVGITPNTGSPILGQLEGGTAGFGRNGLNENREFHSLLRPVIGHSIYLDPALRPADYSFGPAGFAVGNMRFENFFDTFAQTIPVLRLVSLQEILLPDAQPAQPITTQPVVIAPAQTIPAQTVGGQTIPAQNIPAVVIPAVGRLPVAYAPLFYGTLNTPVTVNSTSDTVVIPAGGLVVSAN